VPVTVRGRYVFFSAGDEYKKCCVKTCCNLKFKIAGRYKISPIYKTSNMNRQIPVQKDINLFLFNKV
jgi:uncharacterized protein (UPF0179 family)